ncbi:MAG: DUF6449 domain-containing protein [Eubacteriales bacterium]|nr:DUF6449 domain-containing protein [Eubacteriales bacterium]
MTSKISFSRLRIEDLKHRLSMIIISFFLFFMSDILYYLTLQSYIHSEDYRIVEEFVRVFASGSYWQVYIIISLAALLGINAFHFLHNRSRVDFQMSLPISRRKHFWMIASNGFLIFFLPFLLSILVQTLITTALGVMRAGYFTWIVKGFVSGLLTFFLIYFLMAVCMLLTGQIYVALMAFLVFQSYTFVVIRLVLETLSTSFFQTYRVMADGMDTIFKMLSPFMVCVTMVENYSITCLVAAILWIFVLILASYWLFQIRPAESAGVAMAFSRGKLLIKTMITVPMGIVVGLFLSSVAGLENGILLYLGSILGGVIFHGIIECIYQNDIRALWSHRKHLLANLILIVAVILVFDVDLIGYDSYCPKAEQLEGIKIEQSGASFTEYFEAQEERNIQLSNENCEKIIDKLQEIIEKNKNNNVLQADDNIYYVNVDYYKENGKKIKRTYKIHEEDHDSLLDLLYDTEEYRHNIYRIYSTDAEKIIDIKVCHPEMVGFPALSDAEQKELLSILKEEWDQMTYEKMKKEYPIATIEISYSLSGSGIQDAVENYSVYPEFTKTIAFMKAHDCKMGASAANLKLINLQVVKYNDTGENNEVLITDQDKINAVKDKLYYQELRGNSYSLRKVVGDIYARDNRNQEYLLYADQETMDFLLK